jgi:hypothetical protein
MPVVTNPVNGTSKRQSDKTFTWNMEGVYHTSSWVIVDGVFGGRFYSGTKMQAGTYIDRNVSHPNNNTGCKTRPVYHKGTSQEFTDLSRFITFTSTAG